ncbi:MAG: PAS domain S-box protein, partial [Anaerolineae bacterium]
MPFLDVRTVMVSLALTNILCTIVTAFLWFQNRKRFAGTFSWPMYCALQSIAVLLIALRGSIPDLISMGVANTLIIIATIWSYIGLSRFVGKKSPQIHNYILLALFILIQLFFIYVQPNLVARTLNVTIATFLICFQIMWLLLYRVERSMRRITRGTGVVVGVVCLFAVIRVVVILVRPSSGNDFLHTSSYDTLLVLFNQLFLIMLTFTLALMVNLRLVKDVRTREEKFSKAFRSSPYGITLTWPSDGRILDVNDGFTAISGYSSAEVIGKTTLDLHLWFRDEDRTAVVSELRQGRRVLGREFQFKKKSGDLMTGLFSAEMIEIDDQPWILSSIADITERKQAEEALLKGNTVLKNMLLASSGFINSSSSGIDYQKMTDALLEIAGAKYAAFNAFDENGLDFSTMAISGLPDTVSKASSLLGFQLANKKWKHDPVREEKTRDQAVTVFPSLHDLTGAVIPTALSILIERTFDIGKVVIVKISRNTRVVGDFTIFFSRGYTLQNRELVELFANESGLFMERTQAEEALRASEQKYRLLFTSMVGGFTLLEMIYDGAGQPVDYRHIEVNPAHEALTGLKTESIIGRTIREVLPDIEDVWMVTYGRVDKTGISEHIEQYSKALDRWFSVYVNQTAPGFVAVTFENITERKRAEAALREAELRYRTLADNGQALIWTSGLDKKCTYFNQPWLAFTGRTLEQELGDGWVEGVHPDDLDRCVGIYVSAFDKHKSFSMDYRLRFNTGEYRWIQDDGTPRYDSDGQFLGFIGHCLDITERKQAEEARRESEGKYRDLVEHLSEGVAVANTEDVFTFANPAVERIFGVGSGQLVGNKLSTFLSPENQELVRQKTLQRAQGRSDTYELEIIHSGNEHHFVQVTASPRYDASNRFSGSTGIFRDITESKRAEEEIRSLARFVSENPDAVLRVAQNGILVYVNPQGLAQLPDWHLRVGDVVPSSVQRVVSESMSGTDGLALDLEHGSQIFSFLVVPVVEAGYANLYGHDVTHRRQSEKALADSEERFQLANQATFNVIWDWNLTTGTLWYNENYQKLSGYSADELRSDAEWWTNQIHPQDLEHVMTSIQAAASSGQHRWLDEYRIQRKDGSYADVEVRGHLVVDTNGFPVRMIGAMHDISQRKRSAAYLEMSGQVLQILNESEETQDWIQRVLELVKTR